MRSARERKPLVADGLKDSFKLLRAPKSIRLIVILFRLFGRPRKETCK